MLTHTTMETVLVALIAAVVGPGLLLWMTGRQRRAEKERDYTRQDAVAERVERVAKLQAESNAARAQEAANVAAQLTRVEETGAITHTLVNSDKTAQMEENLASARRELVKSNELIDLRRSLGQEPTPAILEDVEVVTARIAELETELAKRHTTNGVVEHQQAVIESSE